MAIGINWADGVWLDATWEPGVWLDTGVVVPDVVGETQAAGTTTLETALFVVSVATAYSSVVAAGLIISQSPAAGLTIAEGATVTITVSLGEAPVSTDTSGGFYFDFELHRERRRKRQQELDEAEEEAEKLQNKIDREIAELLHEQERKDEKRKDLERIKSLVKRYESVTPAEISSERVLKALTEAKKKATTANLERLQREFERMVQEEDDFLALVMILANE